MIIIKNKNECCGCTACMTVCSKEAISMRPDAMGFLYPYIDTTKCVDCGLCNKVCAFNENYDRTNYYDTPYVYGAWNKDKDEVSNSQSGALFFSLAKYVISQGGVVYGAVFKNVYEVVHKRVETIEDLQSLRGSKYVQSNLENSFNSVILDLRRGNKVLFSGTGCQIAGLHSLLRIKHVDDTNLILCDIVCHGVPSPYVWRDNVKYIEQKYHNKVVRANTRDKKIFGWHSSFSSYQLENGKTVTSNDFNKAFGLCYINRRSCDVCFFSNILRPGDITIGDFWGLDLIDPTLDKKSNGVSLVLINNEKGKHYFDSIKEELCCFESNVEECLQPNLQYPSRVSPLREDFEKAYTVNGYVYAMRKYGELSFKNLLRKTFWNSLRNLKKALLFIRGH